MNGRFLLWSWLGLHGDYCDIGGFRRDMATLPLQIALEL